MRLALLVLLVSSYAAASGPAATPSGMASMSWFAGDWTCSYNGQTAEWHFDAPDSGGWTRLTYGRGGQLGGAAVIGYVPALKQWVYDDFHADGAYAQQNSPEFADHQWVWSGVFYPAGGASPMHGHVVWQVEDERHFTMLFYPPSSAQSQKPSGQQTCVRR